VAENPDAATAPYDFTRPPRTWTRQQRVQLARTLRAQMSTSEIARRLGVSASTVRGYLNDPDGQRAHARTLSDARGRCKRCGQPTGAPRGQRTFAVCPSCAPADRASWTRAQVITAYLQWWALFGGEPTSTDWNHTHARRRGGAALARFRAGRWPTLTVIGRLFGRWSELRAAAQERARDQPQTAARI
jgi:hypothetical protein